jgi:serine/threonine-protein kinase
MKLCSKCQKEFSDDANFCPVCASRLMPSVASGAKAETDPLAARFELLARLGGRRTGAVFRATDKTTGRPVAVKLVDPAVVALPGVAQRLERELKQLERVQSSGVARVVASGRRGDDWWVATEFLDGAQTLADAIATRGPIPAEQAAELVELIGEALIEAAQVGVVHRDLAPKNVLFAGDSVKLINFPVPVPISDKVPGGVPEFAAPEQFDGKPVDQRSNLYSLGAMYYFVLTGAPVFSGNVSDIHERHRAGVITPVSSLVSVPPAVEAAITRALDRSPTKRFLTVRQFVDEVTRVGHGEVIELKQTAAMGRAGANRPRNELVQTLMGLRGGAQGKPVAAPAAAPVAAAAHVRAPTPAPVVAAPVMPRAPTPAPFAAVGQPAPQTGKPMAQTMMGMPGLGMAPVASPPQPAMSRPGSQPAQPAAPAVAAPVVSQPQIAATQAPSAAPAGKKKSADDGAGKGKFRETMWFKKGDLDAQAAQAAAEEQARTGKLADSDRADSLPIDERYKDDGSISRGDKEKYSLRTGATQMMSRMSDASPERRSKVSEDALIGEMKGGRMWVIGAIVVALIAIAAITYLIAS